MIKFEKPEVWGWEHAIQGMRNPLNSWERSDSYPAVDCGKCGIIDREGICHPKEHDCTPYECYAIGDNDKDLMTRLNRGWYNDYNRLVSEGDFTDVERKQFWWNMIQLLPSSFNQKRTVTMTYENLLNMLEYRRGHKLDEWRMFCDWILTLPYGSLLKEGVGNEQS